MSVRRGWVAGMGEWVERSDGGERWLGRYGRNGLARRETGHVGTPYQWKEDYPISGLTWSSSTKVTSMEDVVVGGSRVDSDRLWPTIIANATTNLEVSRQWVEAVVYGGERLFPGSGEGDLGGIIGWSEIQGRVRGVIGKRDCKSEYKKEQISIFDSSEDIVGDCEAIWPIRLRSERRLRLVRLPDLLKFAGDKGWDYGKLRLLCGLYYTLAGSLIVWGIVHGVQTLTDRLATLDGMGMLHCDECFAAGAKQLNADLKTYTVERFEEERYVWLEMGGLGGYRLLPYPGFDVVKESEDLAHGGQAVHGSGMGGLAHFAMIADRSLGSMAKGKWMPFREWVAAANWTRSGACNIGKLKWTWDAMSGEFRIKKNLVPYVFTVEELIAMVDTQVFETDSAAVKPEPGKVRMMVVADLRSYLLQAWLCDLLGHSDSVWPGNTMNEAADETSLRLERMCGSIDKSWGLPFDYSGFDHQPTTKELQVLVKVFVSRARLLVPVWEMSEFNRLMTMVVAGFEDAELRLNHHGKKHTWKITGGLMSGLRLTSKLGNAWNTVMTTWAVEIAQTLGARSNDLRMCIRGDDSHTAWSNERSAALMAIAYGAIGAIGGKGKFGIHHSGSEFLRVWLTPGSARGYVNRSINSLMQTKPWNSTPWSPFVNVEQLVDACGSLIRRGAQEDVCVELRDYLLVQWARSRRLDVRWLWIPKYQGGYGLVTRRVSAKATGKYMINPPSVVSGVTSWVKDIVTKGITDLSPTDSEAKQLGLRHLNGMIASDYIPDVYKAWRRGVRLGGSKVENVVIDIPIPFVTQMMYDRHDDETDILSERTSWTVGLGWKQFGYVEKERARVVELLGLRKVSVMAYLIRKFDSFRWALARLEKWGLKRYEAYDWLTGSLKISRPNVLHSMQIPLRDYLSAKIMGKWVGTYKFGDGQFSAMLTRAALVAEHAIRKSSIATMWRW